MSGEGRADNTALGYNDPLDAEHHEMNFDSLVEQVEAAEGETVLKAQMLHY